MQNSVQPRDIVFRFEMVFFSLTPRISVCQSISIPNRGPLPGGEVNSIQRNQYLKQNQPSPSEAPSGTSGGGWRQPSGGKETNNQDSTPIKLMLPTILFFLPALIYLSAQRNVRVLVGERNEKSPFPSCRIPCSLETLSFDLKWFSFPSPRGSVFANPLVFPTADLSRGER